MTLEQLREICLSMPFSTEDVKYNSELCFSIGKKIFCGTRIEGGFRAGLKCSEAEFSELIERDGIIPLPRLSKTFWIRIDRGNALTVKEWKTYVAKSYALVLAGMTAKERQTCLKK